MEEEEVEEYLLIPVNSSHIQEGLRHKVELVDLQAEVALVQLILLMTINSLKNLQLL